MAKESGTSGRSDSNRSGHDEGEPTSPASDSGANVSASADPGGSSGLAHGTTVLANEGQVTILANVRQRLGLVPGDRLAFTVLADGTTVMRAKRRSIRDLAGSVESGTDRRASIDELSFH